MTYTPGPWEYRPHDHDDWGIVRAEAIKGERYGFVICQARNPDVGFDDFPAYRETGRDPYEANARLIAAAPSLLEALEAASAMAHCCIAQGCYSHDEIAAMARATLPTFTAAIALARGEAGK